MRNLPDSHRADDYLVAGMGSVTSGSASRSLAPNSPAGQPIPEIRGLETEHAVAVVSPEVYSLFLDARGSLARTLEFAGTTAIMLVNYREPPADESRRDGEITSFLCSADVFRQLQSKHSNCSPERLGFQLLSEILDGGILVDRVLAVQLPMRKPRVAPSLPDSARVIIAHRGCANHLAMALRSIDLAPSPRPNVSVGLDGAIGPEYDALLQQHGGIDFFEFSPAPVGPYVIRQELIQRSTEPLLIFQDSDDYATWDRLSHLQNEIQATACDLAGSHEIRVDQISGRATAVRYPLDVNAALKSGPAHALLHGTSAVSRNAFFRAGGLSTDQRFGSDTQFLLRAYFSLRIRNADAFLYLRRIHKEALTVHPSTGFTAPERETLRRQKMADFQAVKNGRISLEDSSLRPVFRTGYQVSRL